LRFPSSGVTPSYAAGLTYSESSDGDDKIVIVTAGSGNITFN
jgi:hypothetical protein